MFNKSLTFGALTMAVASMTTPALSQALEIGRDGIRLQQPRDLRPVKEVTERQAIRIARGEGLRNVEDVRRTRMAYRINGTDRTGDDIRVEVDRETGEVLSVR